MALPIAMLSETNKVKYVTLSPNKRRAVFEMGIPYTAPKVRVRTTGSHMHVPIVRLLIMFTCR